jgi:hypothetical protein
MDSDPYISNDSLCGNKVSSKPAGPQGVFVIHILRQLSLHAAY